MENLPFNITNTIATEYKKVISSVLPNKEDFLIYVKPFLTNIVIRDNYEQFLDILKRAGIKDVEEIIDRIAGFKEVVIDNSPELVQGIINLMQKTTTQLEAKGATFEEIKKALIETMSFENITLLISKTNNDLYDKYQNGFILFDRNTVELSDDEEILTNYFRLLIAKLFLQYMINYSKISEEDFAVFMKEFLLNYFEGMDTMYDEIVPKELITFIEKIKIPNEEKLRAKIVGTTHTIIETTNTNQTKEIPTITKGLTKVEEQAVSPFDYSNNENYFFSDKIKNLKWIEIEMIEKKYLTATGKWNIEKNKLVALIYILKKLEYLRPKIQGKGTNASLLAYRRFFEARYKSNVTEQMKPSKFNIGTLKSYKPDFLFIPEIDKL